MFHTYIVIVLFRCCVYLQWLSSVFSVFFASVSGVYFNCFICLLMYAASVTSGCFKNRSGIAHGENPSLVLDN
jgi:hypothetical protein